MWWITFKLWLKHVWPYLLGVALATLAVGGLAALISWNNGVNRARVQEVDNTRRARCDDLCGLRGDRTWSHDKRSCACMSPKGVLKTVKW